MLKLGVPKFIFTVMVLTAGSAGGAFYILKNLSPQIWYARPLLLLSIFITLEGIFSALLYFLKNKKTPGLENYRRLYRSALKTSLPVATILTGLAGLKIYGALTPITGLLLTGLIASVVIRKTLIRK